MKNTFDFPLKGVIGIVANTVEEIELAAANQLQCIEIRADLLLAGGLSIDELMLAIQRSKATGLAVLFTLRHPGHGGKFDGTEEQRASLSKQALTAGADLVDLEWGTQAASLLKDECARLILSHHDFDGMLNEAELSELTSNMCAINPAAVKVVPTASSLQDAIRMLQWVATPRDKNIQRIGFAMGPSGACSRVLTVAFGAPITYASFGQAVAPGQVEMAALLHTYRAMDLTTDTHVVALTGESASRVAELNESFANQKVNKVAIDFFGVSADELQHHAKALRISEILSNAG